MPIEKSVYNLGKVYGLAERAIPKELGSAQKKAMSSAAPMTYLAEIMCLLIDNKKLSPELDDDIRQLLDDVDPDTPANLAVEYQGQWWLGYNSTRPTDYDKGIASLRKKAGMTQAQLGEAIGVNQRAVSRWETGMCKPDADALKKLAEVLRCKIDALF